MRNIQSMILLAALMFGHLIKAQDGAYPKEDFIPPMNIPLVLSGTFGELRSNHFHSGVDIKTQGREGVPVVSIADGQIVRIKVSPFGFGNAIYVRHNNGYTSVYAHLQKFNKEVQTYVRKQQYIKKSFSIELFPSGNLFSVKQGDTLALSGNSGGSGGPHLHFEMRSTASEKVVNPLLFFDVKDSKSPELLDLQFYDFLNSELLSSKKHKLIKDKAGQYHLAGENVIEVYGKPGFALRTFDRLNGANNKNGVYAIKMMFDDLEYYDFKMETFAFHETRYINSHIDYGQKKCCNLTYNKLFVEPNNRLSIYGQRAKMNLPALKDDSLHQVQIVVLDIKGNTSVLEFKIKRADNRDRNIKNGETNLPKFNYRQTNFFKNDYVDLVLPEGALYSDVYFEFKELPRCKSCYSSVYQLGAIEIPIHKYYNVKIKPSISYDGDKSKLAIASMKNGKIVDYEGGKFINGFVVGRTRQLGEFAVVADEQAPKIRAVNFQTGSSLKGKKSLKIKITDNFSGISSYRGDFNGSWVLMSYDAKNKLLIINLDEVDLKPGNHKLRLVVKDELNNKSVANFTLIL